MQPRLMKFSEEGNPVVRLSDGKIVEVRSLLGNGDGNTKMRKNSKQGVLTYGLSLSPNGESGVGNTCPHASEGCKSACLDHQGMAAVWKTITDQRKAKTIVFYKARKWFLQRLGLELHKAVHKSVKEDKLLAVRLNVFSDIQWEKICPSLFKEFSDVKFYDYTKNPNRVGLVRQNYWTTFSRSESNHDACLKVLRRAGNVAVVFGMPTISGSRYPITRYGIPSKWEGYSVLDGDETDLRFADSRGRKHGRVIGLRLKSHSNAERLSAIESGFAVDRAK